MRHQLVLAAIRAALCDRIDEAALRQQRLAVPDVSIPSALLSAGLWLAARGWTDESSPGEIFFSWGPAAYRRYLDRLTRDQREREVEAGRRVIFEGRGHRPPLFERFTEGMDDPFRSAA